MPSPTAAALPTAAHEVLHFWFEELKPADWFSKNAALDRKIAKRFAALHAAAIQAELADWRSSARGRLAEIVVLDQFSRNLHRDSAEAFAQDSMALVLAQELVAQGLDQQLSVVERQFAYLPYMHSESLRIHAEAVRLYQLPGLESSLKFEYGHKAIIERFGRYPHRNEMLGRISTEEELAFLKQPGSSY